MALERAFARAGGVLIAGTDPTGGGGVIPGFSNQRQLELLVEAGFTPLEAIAIGTLNGARFLGREARIGTLAAGQAGGSRHGDCRRPVAMIADVRKVETVFKQGVGFDPAKLIESVHGPRRTLVNRMHMLSLLLFALGFEITADGRRAADPQRRLRAGPHAAVRRKHQLGGDGGGTRKLCCG